jgi:hypothetical protein
VKKIAFVTCSDKPDFAPDDQLVARGALVHAIPWDNNFSDWQSFDKVVLRSCWNYHLHPEKFLAWLDELERQRVKLFNPVNIVRWNMHKSYLEKLSVQGVSIPQTMWLPKGSSHNLAVLLNERSWQKAVVKPAISATAYNTFLTTREEAQQHQRALDALLVVGDVLVQTFLPEVQQKGEWSLIFFDKKFSHAVLKRPREADFRVQDNFGGTTQVAEPPLKLVNQATKILTLITEPLLYARVDGVEEDQQFLVMELELIEPVLFLSQSNEAAIRFANSILNT